MGTMKHGQSKIVLKFVYLLDLALCQIL
jgi:hypothetical protein